MSIHGSDSRINNRSKIFKTLISSQGDNIAKFDFDSRNSESPLSKNEYIYEKSTYST